MTFRKKDRPTWYTWPELPGFGRVGPWSTGVPKKKSKKEADRVEEKLKELARTRPELVQGVVQGKYTLRALYVATLMKREDHLLKHATDPLLKDVVERFKPLVTDRRYKEGLNDLLRLAPKNARLSHIAALPDPLRPGAETGAKNITTMIGRLKEEGQKPNSIFRGFYMGVSKLLLHEVGKDTRRTIMGDVETPHEDDRREVDLTQAEVEVLLGACGEPLYPIVVFAMMTGWDRGPISRALGRDFDPSDDSMDIRDTKNEARRKREVLSDVAAAVVRAQMEGKGPDDRVFDLTYNQIGHHWVKAREAAGLPQLRFKDLRHVAGDAAAAVMSQRELQDFFRHRTGEMSLRYLSRKPALRKEKLNQMTDGLGLGRAHLRARKGGQA